jgi:hypothetical protein
MASTTVRYAELNSNVLFAADTNAAATSIDSSSSLPNSIAPDATHGSPSSDTEKLTHAASSSAEQEEESQLARFQVNYAFWRRAHRVMKIGLGSPRSAPWIWCLVMLSVAAQIFSAWVLQSMFYYTGTGTGSTDPGMVRPGSPFYFYYPA